MNLERQFRDHHIGAFSAKKKQLNYCIKNGIGEVKGKTYFLDGKAIFDLMEDPTEEEQFSILSSLLYYHEEIEFFWKKLPGREEKDCSVCNGTGELPVSIAGRQGEKCSFCSGTGKI